MANQETPVSVLTPEQIQIAFRLEAIFMPQAKRQRDEAYRSQTRPGGTTVEELKFVHYTSAEAAFKIIKSKRIWMRNTNCMADYREVQHGFDMLNKFFSDTAKMNTFVAALDASIPGVAKEGLDLFNRFWNDIRFNTFITSVSEHDLAEDFHGRLSMWRASGALSPRVALVIKVPNFSQAALALNLLFSPVSYLSEAEVDGVIQEVIANVRDDGAFLASIDRQWVIGVVFNMLLAGVTCLKHEGFREEREWRAIYCPKVRNSALMASIIQVVTGFPQVIYELPLDEMKSPLLADLDFRRIFHRLIVGPSPYPWPMYEAFREALIEAGVRDAKDRVWVSNIPIRTI